MHDFFIEYIKSHSTTPLAISEKKLIIDTFVPKKLRKRQYFLQEGEVCKYMAFIVNGSMRQYSVDEKDAEHIVRLSIENWWAGDRESFTMLTPSIYNIDAWEESEILIATKADLTRLQTIPAISEMSRELDEKHAFAYQKRVNASISFTAEKRYADLEKTYPEFLQRFPQHIIASYLGFTKETLSRVRNQAVKK
ncbi:MAG: Crp/Fnr family transcriptional regulator [Chitinophagaceae bacterium]|nr:Crp/Fnr family transcriptional regulator [Chitinophagaceae bacterium]